MLFMDFGFAQYHWLYIVLFNCTDIAKSGIGVFTFTVIVFNLITELICQDLVVYQQCILILQEAYNIAKNKEDEEKFNLIKNVHHQNKLILEAIQKIEIKIQNTK